MRIRYCRAGVGIADARFFAGFRADGVECCGEKILWRGYDAEDEGQRDCVDRGDSGGV